MKKNIAKTWRYQLCLPAVAILAVVAARSGPQGPEGSGPMHLSATMGDLWTTVAASGQVEALRVGDETDAWLSLDRGDAVEPRSQVRTGRRSRATLTRSADVIVVDPDSEIVLPDAGTAGTRIEQTSGTVLYDVETRPSRGFEVVTPYLVAGVKGTVFSVTVRDGFTVVDVAEGSVEVRNPSGERTELLPGDLVRQEGRSGMLELFRDRSVEESPRDLDNQVRNSRKRTEKLIARVTANGWTMENPADESSGKKGKKEPKGNDPKAKEPQGQTTDGAEMDGVGEDAIEQSRRHCLDRRGKDKDDREDKSGERPSERRDDGFGSDLGDDRKIDKNDSDRKKKRDKTKDQDNQGS